MAGVPYPRFQVVTHGLGVNNFVTRFPHPTRPQVLGRVPVTSTKPATTLPKTTSHASSTQMSKASVSNNTISAMPTTSNHSASSTDSRSVVSTDSHTTSRTASEDTATSSVNITLSSVTPMSLGLPVVAPSTTPVHQSIISMTTQVIVQTSITESDSKRDDIPTILGSVVGAVVLLSISIWAAIAYHHRRYHRRRSSTSDRSDRVSPFAVPSRVQSYPADKLLDERERVRTYQLVDHQEVIDRDIIDVQDDDDAQSRRQSTHMESVIASGDTAIFSPPPAYIP